MAKQEKSATISNPTDLTLLCCPHCNSDFGFYRVTIMKGRGQTNYGFNGADCDNSELHTPLSYKEQKKAFCTQCNHEIKQLKAT